MPYTVHFIDDDGRPVYLQNGTRKLKVFGDKEAEVRIWELSRDTAQLFDTWSDADDARHVEDDVITEVVPS